MEGNKIDRLVRNKVSNLQEKAGTADLREMERLLNQRDRRRRGGWYFLPLGLLLCGACAWAVVHHYHHVAPVAKEVHTTTEKQLPVNTAIVLSTDSADTHSPMNPADPTPVTPDVAAIATHPAPETSQTNHTASNPGQNFTNSRKVKANDEVREPVTATTINDRDEYTPDNPVPASDIETANNVTGTTPPVQPVISDTDTNQTTHEPTGDQVTATSVKQDSLVQSTDPVMAPTDSVPQNLPGDSLPQPITTPEPIPAIDEPTWHVQAGASYNRVSPVFGSTGDYEPYLARRSREEAATWRWGYDISVRKDFGRSQLGTGVEMTSVGEDIRYTPHEDIMESYDDSSYWAYYETEIWSYDSLLIEDTTWIYFDSTLIVVVDSTYFENIDTSYTNYLNKELTLHNGLTSIRTINIPIVFGYQLLPRSSPWGIMPRAGFEFAFITARRGYYLSTDQQELIPIGQWTTYRNLFVNGVASLELRRRLRANTYVVFEPGIRYSIMSWNKDFAHRYFTYYGRVAIGMKF